MTIQYDENYSGTYLTNKVTFTVLAAALTLSPSYYYVNNPHHFSVTEMIYNTIESTNKIQSVIKSEKHPLAKFLGAWEGDDIDEMLRLVYSTRSKF